ncbi:hypothetical protein AAC978_07575 [Desulfitobacterium sp. THU1]|uniref:hypothetical protein n=1 Tax=Desulfitobacterium sp. THU1 TaxID=3138072 RepID=UPI00311ED2E6
MEQTRIKRWLSGLLIVGLIFSPLTGCSKPSKPTNELTEQKPGELTNMLTKENTRVGSDTLALDMGEFPLAQDAQCEIVPVENPSPLEGVEMKAYSFEISTDEELLSVMRLTLPYDESMLAGQSPEGSVCAAYFNEDTDQWEPVPFSIDEQTKTVTIYTDHLSIYGCFEVNNENTRKAYAAYAIPAFAKSKMKGLNADAVITNSVQNGGNPDSSAVEAGLSVLDLSLAISGAGLETAGHITGALGSGGAGSSSLLGDINERLGDLGLLCSIAQVSYGMYNVYNGDQKAIFPCYANALKTGIGYTAGKLGARLYSLASLGTLVIELSLNEFAETAWTGRQDIYEKAYSLYYESPSAKRDARAWAALFISAKEGATTPEKYRLRVEGLVQRYADQFWQDELEVAAYQEEAQKHGFTGGGGLNETMKQDISNRYRDELFRTVIQDAFKLIAEKEAMSAERALLKELNAIKKELNKTCTVELIDTTVSGDKPTSGLAGSVVYIDVPDTVTDADSWSVTLDSEGRGKITFTVLGFLMAGAPRELKLYEAGSSQSAAPDMTLPFMAAYPTTVVELSSPDEEKPEPPKAPPVETATTPLPQPTAKKFAWVLVQTINQDDKANTENMNKGGIYQVGATASPGSYTFSSKYIGETDTYPDPDQISGEGYAMKLDFSVPPTVIQGGEKITLSFNLAFTQQNVSYFDGNGSCRADLDNTRFVNKNGKSFFEIYCSLKYSNKNVLSVSDTITAKAPNGGSEGDRIELWTSGPSGHIGTGYIYEWKMQ